ncbi:hypothetical protein DYH55_02535 [Methylovirgula sp. 4M-Z18]|nr:hypothetical protein DYH55_02535 [Methylovirgula sp. 4M-Z18]
MVDWLRQTFPANTAKHAAQALDVPVRTVENWLTGAAKPSAGAIFAMIGLWGPDFLKAVMPEPPGWIDAASLAVEHLALQRRLVALNRQQEALREGAWA